MFWTNLTTQYESSLFCWAMHSNFVTHNKNKCSRVNVWLKTINLFETMFIFSNITASNELIVSKTRIRNYCWLGVDAPYCRCLYFYFQNDFPWLSNTKSFRLARVCVSIIHSSRTQIRPLPLATLQKKRMLLLTDRNKNTLLVETNYRCMRSATNHNRFGHLAIISVHTMPLADTWWFARISAFNVDTFYRVVRIHLTFCVSR